MQTTSTYDKAEDSESDRHALIAQGNSLRQTAGEKKKLVQDLEAERKNKKGKKTLQYFTEKEECFFDFLAVVRSVSPI